MDCKCAFIRTIYSECPPAPPCTAMSLLLPSLLVLLALLAAAPAAMSGETTVWHRAQVSKDQLAAAATSKAQQVLDEIICAILATETPWCHLFTYEGNTCVLYDVVVDSLADPPPEDTATPCKTRHRNGKTPPSRCSPSLSLAVHCLLLPLSPKTAAQLPLPVMFLSL